MDLSKTVNQLQSEYKKLVTSLSVVDETDPIPPAKLKELLRYSNDFINNLKTNLNSMSLDMTEQNKNATELKKEYEKNIALLKKNLNQTLSIITNERKKASSVLDSQFKKEKQQTNQKVRQYLLDTEYFLVTSEQNKNLLTTDYEEAKHRYDYQRDEAKESYHNIVTKYNNFLVSIKDDLAKEYEKNSVEYKKDYEEIIVKLNKLIEAKTKELNTLNSLLTNERNIMKERNHNESRILNDNIKKISTEKNIQIDKARNQYSKALSDANIERENKRQTYQANSQALLKEFVTKINEIDDVILKTKDTLEQKTDEIKRNYFFTIHEMTTKFHDDIKFIYKKANNNIDHYYQRLIKNRTKEYNKNILEIKKETEDNLLQITKYYTRIIEENKFAKGYLEIDKNYAIKRLTDQEQYDNKYYQEKSNIYENDNSYIIKTANYKFNQKANVLRNQSQKRYKLLERNFSGIEANYYKKIETVQNKINFYNLEIKLTRELKEIISDYQEKNYLNNLHLEEVTNILEIEKNKLLKEYNEEKYQFNIKSITQSLNYGFQRISIQNQRQQKMTDLNSTLEKVELEKKQVATNLEIENKKLFEKYEKLKTQLKYNEDLRHTKFDYNYALFDLDIKTIEKVNEHYKEFFNKIQTSHQKSVQVLFEDINFSLENIQYLEAIYNSFLSCFIKSYNNALDSYTETLFAIIDKRLKFIEEFKYKATYESLNQTFTKQQTNFKEKISIILDQNDSYKKTIDNFNQKIFTLINDNEMLRSSNTGKKKKLDSKSLNIILSNQLKIKEYKEKIDNFKKMIALNDQDLYEINTKIQNNKISFNKEIIRVKRMQANDSKNYSLYRNNITVVINNFKVALGKTIKKSNLSGSNSKNIVSKMTSSQNIFYNLMSKTKNKISAILNVFKENIAIEIKQTSEILRHELESYIKAYDKQKEKAYANFDKESIEKNTEINDKIHQHKILIDYTIKTFENKLSKANIDYQNDGLALKKLSQKSTVNFFNNYYALEDNYSAIVNYHKTQKKLIQDKFYRLKNQSVKWSVNEKDLLNNKLSALIKSKNAEIEYLPIAYKYNTNLLNKETKRKNNEISLSVKQSKNEFNAERKRIEKELQILKTRYNQTKIENDYDQEIELIVEKRKDKNQLNQALKSIRISLDSK